jgi:hypothetical protein
MPEPDALQSTMKVRLKSDHCDTGAVVSAALRDSNAAAAVGVQLNASRLRSYVSGATMLP